MSEAPRNPALDEIAFLLGDWEMTLSHADFLPGPGQTAVGRAEFGLLEEGSLVVMRQFIDPGAPAAARWLIGRDDCRPEYTVLYADARGVSRVYRMSFEDDMWRVWRDDPAFSQRFEARVAADHGSMSGTWEKRSAGGDWEHDFDVDFVRVEAEDRSTPRGARR